jgi:transglutaminase-like putative cysteine protease
VTGWLDQPLLDLEVLDLEAADSVTFLLHQVFRYEYDGPAYELRQRLVALPRDRHGSYVRRAQLVSVGGHVTHLDADGNLVVSVELPVVPSSVEFTLAALVERVGPMVDPVLAAAALTDPRLLVPTRLTSPSPALWELADELRAAYPDDTAPANTALADALCVRLRGEFAFAFDTTSVFTTAAEAYAIRRGVCQDFAHVMLTVCRLAGIPARYVSGHLLGERGGSHAWVEVLVPDPAGSRALAFDPTNGCRAGSRHLPVAVGRDYLDVAPTSGVYSGAANGVLTWTKRAGVVAVGSLVAS